VTDLATAAEVRLTAYAFEQVYGSPPSAVRHAPGTLALLDGLDVPLPWGAVVAAGCSDTTSFYSMNHPAEGVVAPSAGAWAHECTEALTGAPGTRLVVNRQLPAEMRLLTGAETRRATALALSDLHGDPDTPWAVPPSWDLAGTDLRLLVIDVGSVHPAVVPPADPGAPDRVVAALRAGRLADLGQLLTDAHGPGNPAHDEALETALDTGALGGRTVGACVVVLVAAEGIPHIREQVTKRLAPALPRPPRYLTI
jgi:hypothetical protein